MNIQSTRGYIKTYIYIYIHNFKFESTIFTNELSIYRYYFYIINNGFETNNFTVSILLLYYYIFILDTMVRMI